MYLCIAIAEMSLMAICFEFHFQFMSWFSLQASFILNSPRYFWIFLHWPANHLLLSVLMTSLTSLHFELSFFCCIRYIVSNLQSPLLFHKLWSCFHDHFLFIFSFSIPVSSKASRIALAFLSAHLSVPCSYILLHCVFLILSSSLSLYAFPMSFSANLVMSLVVSKWANWVGSKRWPRGLSQHQKYSRTVHGTYALRTLWMPEKLELLKIEIQRYRWVQYFRNSRDEINKIRRDRDRDVGR